MKSALWPIGFVYEKMMTLRNLFFDRGIFKKFQFQVPVVSVGNLTMGGTGKTPIIVELVSWAVANGLRPAVVSRGYKSQDTTPRRVMLANLETNAFGDEPTMLAERFPEIPVYVGAKRVEVVTKLLAEQKVDVIFADDAFQHRQLARDIDILVLDATEKIENYRIVPVGRARESIQAIVRADFIIVNKCNLVSPEEKKEVINFIENTLKDRNTPIIECDYSISKLKKMSDGTLEDIPMGRPTAFLVSGIGNPRSFEAMLSKSFDVRGHLSFRDHHSYDKSDVRKIMEMSRFKNVKYIITTEKDAVKLRSFSDCLQFYVAVLSLKPSLRMKFIYERIIQLRR